MGELYQRPRLAGRHDEVQQRDSGGFGHMTSRRTFMQTAAAWLTYSALPAGRASSDPFEKDLRGLQADLTTRRMTAAELAQFYLDRIAAYDHDGPRLNAVLYVNPRA